MIRQISQGDARHGERPGVCVIIKRAGAAPRGRPCLLKKYGGIFLLVQEFSMQSFAPPRATAKTNQKMHITRG